MARYSKEWSKKSVLIREQGFSLVELSIVLVILGLLTGGILGGQELIRAAELRSVTTEYNQFVTAANTFRQKYRGLPGDLKHATRFWGALGDEAPNASGCVTAEPDGTRTCNGNGDGHVYGTDNGGLEQYESMRFWQHLANAGLINGTFSGALTVSGVQQGVGEVVPASKLNGGAWGVFHQDGTGWQHYPAENYFMLGVLGTGSYLPFSGGVMTPAEAYNLDMKMDDGMPGTGAFLSVLGYNANVDLACVEADSASWDDYKDAEYALQASSNNCAVSIRF